MDKISAKNHAFDIAKALIASSEINYIPNEKCANDLADFIETLIKRLEKIDTES